MKQSTDQVTAELPGVTLKSKVAIRQAARRQRLKDEGKGTLACEVSLEVLEALRKHLQFKDETQGQAVDRILRGYLLRKR
jgi:hypothetical protein